MTDLNILVPLIAILTGLLGMALVALFQLVNCFMRHQRDREQLQDLINFINRERKYMPASLLLKIMELEDE